MTITAVANYMIFAEDGIIAPQMKMVKSAISKIIEKQTLGERETGKAK